MKTDRIMKPVWLKYPDVYRMDMFWRMGVGEEYTLKFNEWYNALSEEDKTEYRELFPEPAKWRGYWDPEYEYWEKDFINTRDFIILKWDEDGTPKYSKKDLIQRINHENREIIAFPKHEPDNSADDERFCLCPDSWYTIEWMTFYYDSIEDFLKAGEAAFKKEHREDEWEKWKYTSALNAIWGKFAEDADNNYLLSTGDSILVMGDQDDQVWGAGLSQDDPDLLDPSKWPGDNLYGFALMEVRDEIRRITKNEKMCIE